MHTTENYIKSFATYVMHIRTYSIQHSGLYVGTMTIMKVKALLFRLYKIDSTIQKLSYKDSKVIELCRINMAAMKFQGKKVPWNKAHKIFEKIFCKLQQISIE